MTSLSDTFILPVLVASPALEHLLATGSIDHEQLHINAYGALASIQYLSSFPHISAGVTSPALARLYGEACFVAALHLRLISDQIADILRAMERGFPPQAMELPAVKPTILRDMITKLQLREDYPNLAGEWILHHEFDWPSIVTESADTAPPAPQSPTPS